MPEKSEIDGWKAAIAALRQSESSWKDAVERLDSHGDIARAAVAQGSGAVHRRTVPPSGPGPMETCPPT